MVCPDSKNCSKELMQRVVREKIEFETDYRLVHPDGAVRDIHTTAHPVFSPTGDLIELMGTVIDVTDRKRREALLAGGNKVLEMVAKGDSLANILDSLCLMVEEQSSDALASILLMDPNGRQLRHGGAPNLPKTYTEAIDGAFIGPVAGSCGTAAYRAQQVIVSDIATDPLWTDFRELASAHSLHACWSTPIISSEGKVIGTFAMYYRKAHSPSAREQDTIRHITHLAGVAIERKLAEPHRELGVGAGYR